MHKSAFNNYDPRPIPLGNDIRLKASPVYPVPLGNPDTLVPKIDQTYDRKFLGHVNFPSPTNEVLPCLVSPALKLNRTYGEPPIYDSYGLRPLTGIARNQPAGLASNDQRDALFKKPLLPEPMNNNMKSFGV